MQHDCAFCSSGGGFLRRIPHANCRNSGNLTGGESPAASISDCHRYMEFPIKEEGIPYCPAFPWRDGKSQIKSELLKIGRENCLYGAFLRRDGRFFAAKMEFHCGMKKDSCRKDENFLPQGRFKEGEKKEETRTSDGFFFLVGVRPRAKTDCPFVSLSPFGLTREQSLTAQRPASDCKVSRKRFFRFHPARRQAPEVCVFPSAPVRLPSAPFS